MYPIRCEPRYELAPWGGNRLSRLPHHTPKKGCAESWEIFPEGVISNGKWKGKTLNWLTKELGEELIGIKHHLFPPDQFPLTLKIFDAKGDSPLFLLPLSDPGPNEVHTKVWISLAPSTVGSGLSSPSDEKEFLEAWKEGEPPFERVDLPQGSALFIPEGRIHTLFAGGFVLEVAPSFAPTTPLSLPSSKKGHLPPFDGSGKGELKVHHGVAETDFAHRVILLGATPLFIADRVEVYKEWELPHHKKSFHLLHCTFGEGELEVEKKKEAIEAGQTYLIPAASTATFVRGRVDLAWIRLSAEREPKHALAQ